MAFKIYTKTGDKGETSLFGGKRLPKHHLRIESYGTVDELNAFIGLIKDSFNNKKTNIVLKEIQDRLFTIGSNLASDPDKDMITPDIKNEDIILLEKEIDEMEGELAPLKSFILPGGNIAVSHCHLARCVCRRAERRVIALHTEEPVPEIIIQYLNRLSDYLFVLGRWVGKETGADEIAWQPRK